MCVALPGQRVNWPQRCFFLLLLVQFFFSLCWSGSTLLSASISQVDTGAVELLVPAQASGL